MATGKDRDPLLMAILFLLAADRAELHPDAAVPTEILLRVAGMTHADIGEVVDKKPDAVRMTISRYEKRRDARA